MTGKSEPSEDISDAAILTVGASGVLKTQVQMGKFAGRQVAMMAIEGDYCWGGVDEKGLGRFEKGEERRRKVENGKTSRQQSRGIAPSSHSLARTVPSVINVINIQRHRSIHLKCFRSAMHRERQSFI